MTVGPFSDISDISDISVISVTVGFSLVRKYVSKKLYTIFYKKKFFLNLLINIIYYVYIDLYIHIFIPN